jgi:glycosyltransferase involved in cell wall biosynthesis
VEWEGGHGDASTPTQVAVVVSLYNYAERIGEALNSVASQDLSALELIVVDDASTDSGIPYVQTWLEKHGQRFQRARLLRHGRNAGLAAARNTAFAATAAPWCLVLDADNALLPQAASALLAVAQQGSDALAVVHPLIEQEVEQTNGGRHTTGLLSTLSWQRTLFAQRREGNYIDAMALVRRSAWQAVGGYVHIPGGWEDFDFWCLLIETGFHGVLCPAVLAQYRCHTGSMLRQSTHANVRRISRLLQHRHPWLQLQLGQPDF